MSFEEPATQSMKGSLLLADPALQDPTFFQSVLLLTEHSSDDGAHGYILNRPIGRTVGDLLSDEAFQDGHYKPLAKIPVFMGGPVSTEHLTFAAMAWSEYEEKLQFSTHLSAQEAMMHEMEGYTVRAFVGYSGWAKGQLEDELARNSWINREPESSIIPVSGVDKLWKDMLREISPWHRLVADEPDDLWLN